MRPNELAQQTTDGKRKIGTPCHMVSAQSLTPDTTRSDAGLMPTKFDQRQNGKKARVMFLLFLFLPDSPKDISIAQR